MVAVPPLLAPLVLALLPYVSRDSVRRHCRHRDGPPVQLCSVALQLERLAWDMVGCWWGDTGGEVLVGRCW